MFFILLFIGWVLAYVFYRQAHRLKTDEKFARKFLAPRQAKQGLATAQRHLQKGEQKEFYDAVYKTLQDYFSNKFHLAPGIFGVAAIRAQLGLQAKEEILEKLEDVLTQCEEVRYASLATDKDKMEKCFRNLQEIVDYFERFRL